MPKAYPIPRPPTEADKVATSMPEVRDNLLHKLAHWVVHSGRVQSYLGPLLLMLFLRPYETVRAVFVYYALRRAQLWNRLVHRFIQFGCSRKPRFIKAQRVPYDPHKQYIISSHPHGILACSLYNMVGMDCPSSTNEGFGKRFHVMDDLNVTLCATDAIQFFPFHGEIYYGRVSDVTMKTMRRIILETKNDPKPMSPLLLPGGFSEACYAGYSDDYDVSFIKGRTGFIKLAIEQGLDIIPTYSFGVTSMYKVSNWRLFQRATLAQKIGLPLVMWRGKYGTNVPFYENTVNVSFDPFPSSSYSLDEADLALEDYCKYLKVCFDAYKGCCEKSKHKELIFAGRHDPIPDSPSSLSDAEMSKL